MAWQGNLTIGDTIDWEFSTISQGVPFTLAGSPVVSAYPDNSLTQLTAGITLNADWDGVVGLNHIRVVASVANGYAAASNYSMVITTGTVNGISVVGYTIGSFSIQARTTSLTAASIQAIWDALTSALTTVGSIGKFLVDRLDVVLSTRTKPADTQVTDVTQTTRAEPGQGAPPATATPATKLDYLAKAWRNRTTQTATTYKLYADDAATVDQKASFSDDTITADRSEIGSGP